MVRISLTMLFGITLNMFIKSTFFVTSFKMCLFFIILSTQGCSLVQWLPSTNCEYIEYVRVQNQVSVKADCEV